MSALPVVLLCLFPAADDLGGKIDAVVNDPDYKQARWGLLAVESKTGRVVIERNADRLFAPASTTKLYSCATALCELGPDHRFETPVYRRGSLKEGTLSGDLVLVASGDLTFGGRTDRAGRVAFRDSDHTYANGNLTARLTDTDPLAALTDLARQVKAAGVRKVRGDVLVDARLFDGARGTGSGPDVLSPILVNDNVVDLVVTPGAKAGEPAHVSIRPETALVQMDARVETVEAGKESSVQVRTVGPWRFTVRGRVTVGRKPLVRIWTVDDPAAFARGLFIEALRREGVDVGASPLAEPRGELPEKGGYGKLERVALHTSPPLSETIKVTLKVSHNLYASTLPLLVAVKHGERSLADGMQRQGKFLAGLGVDVKTISFGGGAGGAAADMITPRATVQLLAAMSKRPEFAAYKDALPVLGVDGTLADVVDKNSPARGKVFAKTGTLSWNDQMNDRSLLRSKALAGVMTTAKGTELYFAMFVNDVPLAKGVPTQREGKVLGRLCEILYRHGP